LSIKISIGKRADREKSPFITNGLLHVQMFGNSVYLIQPTERSMVELAVELNKLNRNELNELSCVFL